MILKNKNNTLAQAQIIVSPNPHFSEGRVVATIFRPKGLNFSSLYQKANFSSNRVRESITNEVTKAISNKAITPSFFKTNTAFAGASALIQKPTLGPIQNKKLLAYNFLANTNMSSLKKNKLAIVYSEDIIKLISAFLNLFIV